MRIHANGTQLWFDVDGPALVPDGAEMRHRPTVVVLHGGPGFDHSLYKEDLWRLTDVAQVLYLDQRGHGRSAGELDEEGWSLERWADDVRALCDALGVERPVVWGHSFGSFVAAAYAARHPDHAGGLVLQSTRARFDLDRIAAGFRRVGGDEISELARRYYAGDPTVTGEFVARALPLAGPWVPGEVEMARAIMNERLLTEGLRLLRDLDLTDALARIACPVLVCVGDRDPSAQVADAEEVVAHLPDGRARLEVLAGAGHFAWKDVPDRYWATVGGFVADVDAATPAEA